jgi:hypothetical protein
LENKASKSGPDEREVIQETGEANKPVEEVKDVTAKESSTDPAKGEGTPIVISFLGANDYVELANKINKAASGKGLVFIVGNASSGKSYIVGQFKMPATVATSLDDFADVVDGRWICDAKSLPDTPIYYGTCDNLISTMRSITKSRIAGAANAPIVVLIVIIFPDPELFREANAAKAKDHIDGLPSEWVTTWANRAKMSVEKSAKQISDDNADYLCYAISALEGKSEANLETMRRMRKTLSAKGSVEKHSSSDLLDILFPENAKFQGIKGVSSVQICYFPNVKQREVAPEGE